MPTSNAINVDRARRACLVGLAGLALVILPASLAEAEYGPGTKIGTNYQQTSNTTSTNGRTAGNCSDVFACYVLLQLPPAQKTLIVQHVSCLVTANGSLRFGYLQTRKGQDFPLRYTLLVPIPTTSGQWVVSSPVMHLVESGERPLVKFSNSIAASWGALCTISGKLQ